MNDHAGRLVDRRDLVVLVEDVQRDVFGNRALARQLGQHDADPLARPQPMRRLAPPALDFDAGGVDHLAQVNAAIRGKPRGQEDIQPGPLLIFGHDQFGRLARELVGGHASFSYRSARRCARQGGHAGQHSGCCTSGARNYFSTAGCGLALSVAFGSAAPVEGSPWAAGSSAEPPSSAGASSAGISGRSGWACPSCVCPS